MHVGSAVDPNEKRNNHLEDAMITKLWLWINNLIIYGCEYYLYT